MSRVSNFELIDHGIDHSQYFQGCGTAFTKFDHVATGCGDNPAEALEDCLEFIAQGVEDVDTEDLERRILTDEGIDAMPETPSVATETDYSEGSELYYYVSIRYNVSPLRPSTLDLIAWFRKIDMGGREDRRAIAAKLMANRKHGREFNRKVLQSAAS